jgi:hypothetical protein
MERISEVLFGLIMVLTVTCSFSVAEADPKNVHAMLLAALGCNLAGVSSTRCFIFWPVSVSKGRAFDTKNRDGSFFYSWPQLTHQPLDWFHVGLVAQRTKAYHTSSFDTQRGFLIGFSHKQTQFTTSSPDFSRESVTGVCATRF